MHIVHMEDTRPLRDILLALMTTLQPGCNIQQFVNSDDALAYIEAQGDNIDLFLLDVRVPGALSGLEVAERIKALGCTGLVVMTSAYMSPGRERLRELNARWYQKPWQIQDAQEMLRLAAEKRPTL
jgi:CheY-like chemotaxis protein